MPTKLSEQEKSYLLRIAREAIVDAVTGKSIKRINLDELPEALRGNGASFVTLTKNGALRGCIGTLTAYQPLALDVQEHAIAAALQDYRFDKVTPSELKEIHIEISRLTMPERLSYDNAEELIHRLRPMIDGVILSDGYHKATFLPQVWDQLPNPQDFLSHLCLKMGVPSNFWRKKILEVSTYQVEDFHEEMI